MHLGTAVVGFLVLSAAFAAAQPAPILNIIEVQKLVASDAPADQARLATHFTELADQSSSQAKRHETMWTAYAGHRSPSLGASMGVHCARLAELNSAAATTLGELAAHHRTLAMGAASTVPPNAAAYHSGKGARTPTGNDLRALAAKANTAADHRALMEYFLTTAKRHAAAAADYTRMAQFYRGTKLAAAGFNADHLAMWSRGAEKEAIAAATMHEDLAGLGR
jgi:hypothetical protein